MWEMFTNKDEQKFGRSLVPPFVAQLIVVHRVSSCNSSSIMSEKPIMLCINGRDTNPRSEDLRGGHTNTFKKMSSSKDNSSLGTFPYQLLAPFVLPSEEKVRKLAKYVFKDCILKDSISNPLPNTELLVPGLPIPIINALTKECLRTIANALHIKCTYRSSISQMRKDIVAVAPHSCAWSLVFVHKSFKAAKSVARRKAVPSPDVLLPNPVLNMVPDSADNEDSLFPPSIPTKSTVEAIVNGWVADIHKDLIEEAGCQVCGLLTSVKDLTKVEDIKEKFDFSLLECSDNLDANFVTRAERKSFSDPIKQLPGPVIDPSCDRICNICLTSLLKRKVPRNALARGLWIGAVPEVLSSLSFAEKILIARVRTSRYVVRVSSGLYKMSGNAIAFSIPMPKVYKELPPTTR